MRPDRHALAEHRSLLLHDEIARRLACDPALVERARARVDVWLISGAIHEEYALAWQEALRAPLESLCALLRDPGQRARALRQVTPFAFVVDARTRNRLWHAAAAQWERARAAG